MNDDSVEIWDKNMASCLEYFLDRSNLLFSYHFCTLKLEQDADFNKDVLECDHSWALKTIQSACLNTTLMALRDIDDFFTPPEVKKELKRSVRASDLTVSYFKFEKSLAFLSGPQRKAIDQIIAHTTEMGLQNLSKQWDILELISQATAQCIALLDWIILYYGFEHFNTLCLAGGAKSRMAGILNSLQHEAGRRRC